MKIFHENSVCSDLVDVPRIFNEEIWTSCLAGVLCNQSLIPKQPRVTTVNVVWLKWPISFYSGKDLCTEGEFLIVAVLHKGCVAHSHCP